MAAACRRAHVSDGDAAARPQVGPHARARLAAWDNGPEPGEADREWLAVEAAAAALEDRGPDEALSRVWEGLPGTGLDERLARVRATGHPEARALAQAVAQFAASDRKSTRLNSSHVSISY